MPIPLTDLIRVDEDDLLDVERKHDVKEENFVAPDDPLLLLLLVQPPGPLVLHVLVVEAVAAGILGQELLDGRREVALQDPELDLRLGCSLDAEHHDLEQAFVQVSGGQAENVEDVLGRVLDGGGIRARASERRPDGAPEALVVLGLVGLEQILVPLLRLLGNFELDDFALKFSK